MANLPGLRKIPRAREAALTNTVAGRLVSVTSPPTPHRTHTESCARIPARHGRDRQGTGRLCVEERDFVISIFGPVRVGVFDRILAGHLVAK